MKLPSSLSFSLRLLPLLSLLTLLTFRSTIRHTFLPPPPPPLLLRLASRDPYSDSTLKPHIESLLSGNLPSSPHPPILSPRSAAALRLPALRLSILNWWRHRGALFHPQILSHLSSLIKPHSSNSTPTRFPSCAVVGNSGILLNSNHGRLIDSHRLIIRLNNAPIGARYQRDVGSKTNLSFVNSNVLHQCARRPDCACHPYGENVPIVMYICQAVHFLDHAACEAKHRAPLLITDLRFDEMCGRIARYYSVRRFVEAGGGRNRAEDWERVRDADQMFHYSSGMQAVVLALGICDRVGVFGFGKSEGARHHYHTSQKAELDLHDYEAEYQFYRDLVDRPEEIPFLRDSGLRVPPIVLYR